MKLWTWLLAAALLVATGTASEAGKRKGARSARIAYDVAKTVGGLSIKLELINHKERSDGGVVGAFTLTVKKGKRKVIVESGWVDAPWFELVAHGKLIQVQGTGDGVEVTVAPTKGVAKKAIGTDQARALVEAEADKRGVDHSGSRISSGNGVLFVSLQRAGVEVIAAVIGARSRDLLAFEVVATDPPAGDGGSTSVAAQMQEMLDAHNQRRAEHCAPALSWSDELAAVAQAWADRLRDDGCAFDHSQTRFGENLAAGTSGSLPPADVVEMWYREIDQYDFDGGGFSMETGHFTQVVWKASKRLGCGVAQCNGLDLWVCNYDPAGNVERGYAKNVLPKSCQ